MEELCLKIHLQFDLKKLLFHSVMIGKERFEKTLNLDFVIFFFFVKMNIKLFGIGFY